MNRPETIKRITILYLTLKRLIYHTYTHKQIHVAIRIKHRLKLYKQDVNP